MRAGPDGAAAPDVATGRWRSSGDCVAAVVALAASFLEHAADNATARTSEAMVMFVRMRNLQTHTPLCVVMCGVQEIRHGFTLRASGQTGRTFECFRWIGDENASSEWRMRG
jgi:hypothetical protein